MIVSGVLLAVMILFLFMTRNYKKELFEKKECFYPSACFLLEKLRISRYFSDRQRKRIFDIFIGEDAKKAWMKYQCQRISCGLGGILAVLIFLFLFSMGAEPDASDRAKGRIFRPSYGAGDETLVKDITLKSTEEGGDEFRSVLKAKVREKQYSQKEWEAVLEKVKKYIDEMVPGENTSLDMVEKPLRLPEKYPGSSIKIKWNTDKKLINSDGSLKNTWKDTALPEDGVLTELVARISCGNYRAEYPIFLRIFPKRYTKAEQAWHQLELVVLDREKETGERNYFDFPERIGKYQLIFHTEKDNTAALILVLGIIFSAACSMIPAGKIKEAEKKREQQLLMDYPKMLNRFVLLVGAGMTIRGVFEKLVQEYVLVRKRGGEKRYVFEEMEAAVRAMENGAGEADAMEAFGKRIKLMPYLRFTSLLIQNRKKGTEDLLFLLEGEAASAMEQNREQVRIMGEKAGTKLLIPMVMMLCIVFFIIMVPAFLSF